MPVGAGKWLTRSPVTHIGNSLYCQCLTRGRAAEGAGGNKPKKSVVVRLKDTQLHQPSSLWALHKASLCLKLWILQQEMSARLGLSQGRLQKDVVPDPETGHYASRIISPVGSFVQGLWDILLHASFSTPRNWGIIWAFLLHICICNMGEYILYVLGSFLQHSFSLSHIYTGFKHQMSQAKSGEGSKYPGRATGGWNKSQSASHQRTGSCGCSESRGSGEDSLP